jgi:hypothetical protein
LEEKVVGPVKKIEIMAVGDPSRWPRDLYQQHLALTWPTRGGRPLGIVASGLSLLFQWRTRSRRANPQAKTVTIKPVSWILTGHPLSLKPKLRTHFPVEKKPFLYFSSLPV